MSCSHSPSSSLRVISGLGHSSSTPCPSASSSDGQHHPLLQLDPRTYDRSLDCVHCGLCLPVCPTYTQNGLETDSPRGRIQIIKGLADGRITPTAAVIQHLDLCLDCRACETACPSGVVYHELIEETRHRLASQTKPALVQRLIQALFFHVFPYPRRLKLVMLGPRLLQKIRLWKPLAQSLPLPAQLAKMQQMLPPNGPLWESPLLDRYPGNPAPGTSPGNSGNTSQGQRRPVVAFLSGCVGSVLFQQVNRQAIALLQHAGCDVLVPRNQTCCGAIHHHGGQSDQAQKLAKQNIDAFLKSPEDPSSFPDAIVTNIAGCGAMLQDYPHLLRDDPQYAPLAKEFAARVRDISQYLVELRLPAPTHPIHLTVTYHDACHLAHAQKVIDHPRQLLAAIPGLKLIPLPEADMCCGAAGTYNLSQPAMSRQLAERKIANIQRTGASVCAMGNVGCAMQIQSEADRLGVNLKVVHPVTLLHQAYFPVNSPKPAQR